MSSTKLLVVLCHVTSDHISLQNPLKVMHFSLATVAHTNDQY